MTTPPDRRSPQGPQSPAGPQSPSGPQPAPGTPPPPPQGLAPPPGPQSPGAAPAPQAPQYPGPPATPAGPAYGGSLPPGGWQQPIARPSVLPPGVTLASWGSRVGATLLDALVLLVILLVLIAPGVVLMIVTDAGAPSVIALVLGILAYIGVGLLYAPFWMKRPGDRNGQTLGKQWVGIRVLFVDGKGFGWGQGLLREVVIKQLGLGIVSSLASTITFFLLGLGGLIPYFLDYCWPLWDDENRAVHDMIVNTRVVRA